MSEVPFLDRCDDAKVTGRTTRANYTELGPPSQRDQRPAALIAKSRTLLAGAAGSRAGGDGAGIQAD